MRQTTRLYSINGKGILVPDADVTVKSTDVEGESARDRSGMLHRTVLRQVKSWEFSYRQLSDEEMVYMKKLLTPGVFSFTDPLGEALCCCRGYRIDHHNTVGEWKNLRFLIEEV